MGTALGQQQVVQRQVAEAAATRGAGRAYLYATFQETWAAALQGAAFTRERKLQMQLATSHAIRCAATAVDLAHAAAGTSSLRNECKFQPYCRDVHPITQPAVVSASRYESAGALLLGEESDWGFFAFYIRALREWSPRASPRRGPRPWEPGVCPASQGTPP